MYQERIAKAAVLMREVYDAGLAPPATEEALAVLQQRTREELHEDLPDEYLDFLRVTDGLRYNGLFLYGTDGDPAAEDPAALRNSFVENNLDWRSYERRKKYLIFGDGDISLYAYNLIEKRYELQDRSSGTVLMTFDTFDALAAEALRPYVEEEPNSFMETLTVYSPPDPLLPLPDAAPAHKFPPVFGRYLLLAGDEMAFLCVDTHSGGAVVCVDPPQEQPIRFVNSSADQFAACLRTYAGMPKSDAAGGHRSRS